MIVAREEPSQCSCGAPLRQDEDVLDTWFSSWLVTFSSLGWPEKTRDLDRFYPGSTLVTAPEILFFWVARMVMAGCWFMGEIPFSTVYLHGTVRDTLHRKMSKSLGNGIDPLEVVSRFGADALRYTVISGMAVGTDVILDPNDLETSFASGRNFANKLWNAGRFVLSNLGGSGDPADGSATIRPLAGNHPDVVRGKELTLADRWIISRCNAMVIQATEAYDKYRLNEAANAVYHFLWSDFADWYIEQIKPRLYGDQPGGDVARAVAARTFEVALQLLHPIMPFITEALWKRLPGRDAEASISITAWPRPDRRANDAEAERAFALVQELVIAVRQIRAEYGIEPGKSVRAVVTAAGKDAENAFHDESGTIRRLAKLSELRFGGDSAGVGASAVLTDRSSLFVPLGEVLDLDKERSRLQSELQRLTRLIENQKAKLGNEQFTTRAPQEIVAKEREKLSSWSEQHAVLVEKRARLE
jgi:valyl-tRNA synthetase